MGTPTKAFPSDCWDKIFLTELVACAPRGPSKCKCTRVQGAPLHQGSSRTRHVQAPPDARATCKHMPARGCQAARTLPTTEQGTPAFLYASTTMAESAEATSMTRPSSSANSAAIGPWGSCLGDARSTWMPQSGCRRCTGSLGPGLPEPPGCTSGCRLVQSNEWRRVQSGLSSSAPFNTQCQVMCSVTGWQVGSLYERLFVRVCGVGERHAAT